MLPAEGQARGQHRLCAPDFSVAPAPTSSVRRL